MIRSNYSSSAAALFAFGGWLLVVSAAAPDTSDCVKGIEIPAANYSDWPELFRLTTPNPEDPTQSNRNEAGPVDPSMLLTAGVVYRYLDPTDYEYPNKTKEIPWNPPADGNNDGTLQQIRDENDYQYADIVVVDQFSPKFYEEHIHAGGDEIRYVLDGTGYFDIRDVNDDWIRLHAKAGDLLEFPAGIEHRFAVDNALYIQAMRLFPGSGEPDWSSVSRSQVEGNNTARNEYVEKYLCGRDPDLDHDHAHESSFPGLRVVTVILGPCCCHHHCWEYSLLITVDKNNAWLL